LKLIFTRPALIESGPEIVLPFSSNAALAGSELLLLLPPSPHAASTGEHGERKSFLHCRFPPAWVASRAAALYPNPRRARRSASIELGLSKTSAQV